MCRRSLFEKKRRPCSLEMTLKCNHLIIFHVKRFRSLFNLFKIHVFFSPLLVFFLHFFLPLKKKNASTGFLPACSFETVLNDVKYLKVMLIVSGSVIGMWCRMLRFSVSLTVFWISPTRLLQITEEINILPGRFKP